MFPPGSAAVSACPLFSPPHAELRSRHPDLGLVRAGQLEQSNVNLAEEFADMIVTQRGFTRDELISAVRTHLRK